MTRTRSILYVQYVNPAAYPPLEHSSRLLADAGWQVDVLGIGAHGEAGRLSLPPHRNIRHQSLGYLGPGWQQKLHYLMYIGWVLAAVAVGRYRIMYCSDLLSCMPGLLARWLFRVPVVYHEHDPPALDGGGAFIRWCLHARRRLVQEAILCVIPNRERASQFTATLPAARVACVWNCPEVREVLQPVSRQPSDRLVAWFHGSLTPSQLPLQTVDAIARVPDASLKFAGYETIGHPGYIDQLLSRAKALGVSDRVRYLGAIPSRAELLAVASSADIGLLIFKQPFRDPMAGASNKPFDYLACGLALVYPSVEEWDELYGSAGADCGRGCDPADPVSIAAVLRWFAEHPDETRAMGERGRQRVLDDWNYENQFALVMAILEGDPA